MIEKLRVLRAELEMDLMYCTTRDSHIRLAQRIAALDLIISQLDTPQPSGTVAP